MSVRQITLPLNTLSALEAEILLLDRPAFKKVNAFDVGLERNHFIHLHFNFSFHDLVKIERVSTDLVMTFATMGQIVFHNIDGFKGEITLHEGVSCSFNEFLEIVSTLDIYTDRRLKRDTEKSPIIALSEQDKKVLFGRAPIKGIRKTRQGFTPPSQS